ncbi:hypothetical protein [Neisseria weaveri]|uniref:hypothetical protein n=1 Tax=Neisseria weaveri TaxID=28091 RepID=UPI0007C9ABF2|nr:hypothetical protein [Neisseria weaveri]SAY51577.1 Uncharacterised protein [Neisseria weaveri]
MKNQTSVSQHSPASETLAAFRDSDTPQCLSNHDGFLLNEAAYLQIERVIDMLAAISTFSRGQDKREEQLFNTLSFSSELLEQAIKPRPQSA